MRTPTQPVLIAALAALLAGCAAPAQDIRTTDPEALVGVWSLDTRFDSPEQPFLAFAEDGTWVASDGCNRVRGTWKLDAEGVLSTTSGPQTRMFCEGAQLPLAVTLADGVEVDGDRMRIHSSAESTVTELVRATDPTIGPQGQPIGYWVAGTDPDAPYLSISADGTFAGSDGCNQLSGSWSTNASDDERTDFTDVGMTLRACDGVDQWLSGLAMARVQAGVMTIQSADGTVLGQLTSTEAIQPAS